MESLDGDEMCNLQGDGSYLKSVFCTTPEGLCVVSWTSSSLSEARQEYYFENSESEVNAVPATRDGQPQQRNSKTTNVRHALGNNCRPAFQVERRNARERRRVQSVNVAFSRLHHIVPHLTAGDESRVGIIHHRETPAKAGANAGEMRTRRVSKVATLRRAIEYIKLLERRLANPDVNSDTDQTADDDMCGCRE